MEANVLVDPGGVTPGQCDKQSRHFSRSLENMPEENSLIFTTPPSSKGVSIDIYRHCIQGKCSCRHMIGNDISQMKPCRFAAFLYQSGRTPSEEEKIMFDGIVDGFSIVSNEVESYDNTNYLSILSDENKSKMDKIVKNEISNGMLEVVACKPKCIHSLGAVGKPDGGLRPITDCSLPVGKCINDNMQGLARSFSFKSVDTAVQLLNQGDYVTVVDIKSAYRAVSVNPDHTKLQGLRWDINGEEKYLIDKRLCFGLRCAPFYFFLISEFVYNILTESYNLRVVNYLDDFAAISSSYDEGLFAQNCIVWLLRFLGFHISWAKVMPPSQNAIFLGIVIDTVLMEIRLPEGKLEKTLGILKKVCCCKSISKKNLEKLTGLLGHCSTVVRGGRTFCRRLYNLHKLAHSKHLNVIRLGSEAKEDINWWIKFIRVFNGKSAIHKPVFPYDMISDSSRKGYAVYLGEDWLYGSWDGRNMFDTQCNHLCPDDPHLSPGDRVNINVLELWPVLVGINRWGEKVAGHELNVVVDNMQVFYMVKTGRSINDKCMNWLRDLFWKCVSLDIDLKPVYIRSEDNIGADSLSRILYANTSKKLANLLSGYSLCCKDELICYYRNFDGEASEKETVPDESVSRPVYVAEQEIPVEMLSEIL